MRFIFAFLSFVFLSFSINATSFAKDYVAGDQFQVNTVEDGHQQQPSVAVASDGSYVVVWASYDYSSPKYKGIYLQRYAGDGIPIGGEKRVSTYGFSPDIAMAEDGSFVVAWTHGGQVYVYLYNADATLKEKNIVIVPPGYSASWADIAVAEGGAFVVTWSQRTGTYGQYDVYARRFKANGDYYGESFMVNADTQHDQMFSSIGIAQDGSFVIAWRDRSSSCFGVCVQRFDAEGIRQGGPFSVDGQAAWTWPSIAVSQDGSFVVTWAKFLKSYDDDVFAQRYDAQGQALAPMFRVNTYRTNHQSLPTISMAKDGSFIIVYQSDGNLRAQFYDSSGIKDGAEFKLNTTTARGFLSVALAPNASSFVVVFQRRKNATDVFGIRYGLACQAPVADAGDDIFVEQAGVYGSDVTLDGSASEGEGLIYEWSWEGGIASGVNPTITLPRGEHTIGLTTGIESCGASSDDVQVTVQDTIAPSVNILSPLDKDYTVADSITVDFVLTDGGSGIANELAELDGITIEKGSSINMLDLFSSGGETHSFEVSAKDEAGNETTQLVTFKVIVNAGAVADVIRALIASGALPANADPSLINLLDNPRPGGFLGQVNSLTRGRGSISSETEAILRMLADSLWP